MTVHTPSTDSFSRLWAELATIGRASTGGYRRYAWTREDHTLREWLDRKSVV